MTTSTSTTVTVMMEVCKRRKRKNSNLDSDDQSFHPDSHLLFRKHFEATFQPLPEQQPQLSSVGENEEDSTDEAAISDWEGLSDVEQAEEVAYQVTSQTGGVEVSRTEQRAFMSSKAPRSLEASVMKQSTSSAQVAAPNAEDDTANVKNDLALQRLLKESHLLESQSSLSHTGWNRHKAIDLRLQDLGSKSSVFGQENMPMAQRKGILAKATEREAVRRREALANGIVLEKAKKVKDKTIKRQRGIGAPSVGRFHKGTLKLSRRDLAEIQGPKKRPSSRR